MHKDSLKQLHEVLAKFTILNQIVMTETMEWAVRQENFSDFFEVIYQALITQTSELLRTDALAEMQKFAKADLDEATQIEIDLETQKREIVLTLSKFIKPLPDYLPQRLIIDYYVWGSEIGGQNILNTLGSEAIFSLSNTEYLNSLLNQESLLIESVDKTTKDWVAGQILKGKGKNLTDHEIANEIRKVIPETYERRAETIAFTELTNAVNRAEFETARRSGAQQKAWRTTSINQGDICLDNEYQGWLQINAAFASGDIAPPAHPNCPCTLEYQILPITAPWTGE